MDEERDRKKGIPFPPPSLFPSPPPLPLSFPPFPPSFLSPLPPSFFSFPPLLFPFPPPSLFPFPPPSLFPFSIPSFSPLYSAIEPSWMAIMDGWSTVNTTYCVFHLSITIGWQKNEFLQLFLRVLAPSELYFLSGLLAVS